MPTYLQRALGALLLPGLLSTAALAQLSVRDVQYTTDPSGNSPRLNQTVQVQGVVTAVEYNAPPYAHSLFLADTTGGPWSGLLVASFTTLPAAVGDWVQVTGQVKETGGQTSLQFPFLTVLGTASLPDPEGITAAELPQEAYEGVLAALHDVTVTAPEANGLWKVSDGSGEASIGHTWDYIYQPALGDTLEQIRGVVAYVGAAFRLEPRSGEDLVFSGNIRPVISNVQRLPQQPTASDAVMVSAVIADDGQLTRTELHYSLDNGATWTSVDLEPGATADLYAGWIPAQVQGTVVQYFIQAEDDEGAVATAPEPPAWYSVGAPRASVPMDSIVTHFSQFNNQDVTVEGLITYMMQWTTSTGSTRISAYLQDASGRGLELSESGSFSTFPGLRRGNYISLTGEVGEFDGSAQISGFDAADVTVIYSGYPISFVEPPDFLPTGDPNNEDLLLTDTPGVTAAGTWCKVKGYLLAAEWAGGGTNLTLNDGSGPVVIRIWDDMNVPGAIINGDTVAFANLVGQTLSVSGAVSWYNGFQIEAGYAEDIHGDEPVAPASPEAEVWVEPHPFVPDRGETITIRYNAPAGAWIRLRVLNLRGQMAAMLRDGQSGGGYEIEWDGRDELNRRVPLGVYIVQLQSTLNGRTTVDSAPVVVGTKLK
ncbi:MAG: hypothetical protein C4524_09445 [Candidatus Zixiibacteriota bacterium]|nr:MAG: hypothetical protein C4524_09445 [candidate division Zixibacteria bacterium]